MDKTQKEKIREKWKKRQKDNESWKLTDSEDEIADWWLEQFDLAIKETEERLVREIEEVTDDFGNGEAYSKFPSKDIVVLIKNRITNLLRNK